MYEIPTEEILAVAAVQEAVANIQNGLPPAMIPELIGEARRFVEGYVGPLDDFETPDAVPDAIKQAMLLRVVYRYKKNFRPFNIKLFFSLITPHIVRDNVIHAIASSVRHRATIRSNIERDDGKEIGKIFECSIASVLFTEGYTGSLTQDYDGDTPQDLIEAMAIYACHLYENDGSPVPDDFFSLIGRYRKWVF